MKLKEDEKKKEEKEEENDKYLRKICYSSWDDLIPHAKYQKILANREIEINAELYAQSIKVQLTIFNIKDLTIKKYQCELSKQSFKDNDDIILLYKDIPKIYQYFFQKTCNLQVSLNGSIGLKYEVVGDLSLYSQFYRIEMIQIEACGQEQTVGRMLEKFKDFHRNYIKDLLMERMRMQIEEDSDRFNGSIVQLT